MFNLSKELSFPSRNRLLGPLPPLLAIPSRLRVARHPYGPRLDPPSTEPHPLRRLARLEDKGGTGI